MAKPRQEAMENTYQYQSAQFQVMHASLLPLRAKSRKGGMTDDDGWLRTTADDGGRRRTTTDDGGRRRTTMDMMRLDVKLSRVGDAQVMPADKLRNLRAESIVQTVVAAVAGASKGVRSRALACPSFRRLETNNTKQPVASPG